MDRGRRRAVASQARDPGPHGGRPPADGIRLPCADLQRRALQSSASACRVARAMGFERRYRGAAAAARARGSLLSFAPGRDVRLRELGQPLQNAPARSRPARDQAAVLPPAAGRHCVRIRVESAPAARHPGHRSERGTGFFIPWLHSGAQIHLPRNLQVAGGAHPDVAGRQGEHRALLEPIDRDRRAQRRGHRCAARCAAARSGSRSTPCRMFRWVFS